MPIDELVVGGSADVVGAKPSEVAIMNSLTVNLHLLMVSFYRPSGRRNKIIYEANCFGSDYFAFESQARLHGLEPSEVLLPLATREGEETLRTEDPLARGRCAMCSERPSARARTIRVRLSRRRSGAERLVKECSRPRRGPPRSCPLRPRGGDPGVVVAGPPHDGATEGLSAALTQDAVRNARMTRVVLRQPSLRSESARTLLSGGAR